ncbi:hypothetical protein EDB80DRAFT_6671 [Ilyonectria destructans]|nr:hypothetical protein EDB80DRAFT_6671 [Ilyonectria destructans]
MYACCAFFCARVCACALGSSRFSRPSPLRRAPKRVAALRLRRPPKSNAFYDVASGSPGPENCPRAPASDLLNGSPGGMTDGAFPRWGPSCYSSRNGSRLLHRSGFRSVSWAWSVHRPVPWRCRLKLSIRPVVDVDGSPWVTMLRFRDGILSKACWSWLKLGPGTERPVTLRKFSFCPARLNE